MPSLSHQHLTFPVDWIYCNGCWWKGMGQYRFLAGVITDYSTWSISLSSPWDVEPDSTSTITITKMKGRILGIGNNFGSEGIHMWSWFASADVIYAENTFGANFTDYTQTYHLDWQMPPVLQPNFRSREDSDTQTRLLILTCLLDTIAVFGTIKCWETLSLQILQGLGFCG
ncbi:hypothetical protein BCR33DRAFT_247217 [Rhizoclosmatium globosum]|uniref:Uncharacterized protein n=1 Tax=Rhizoclosmatium globosum TaxID=329046 RepID=A0A1Y2C9M7_9FUNG|nr:hypothetical protein BCR33DRAFT_247217 [Rhizoclosmatium globosum]|eukprot:ORY43740.1 hypothetical protein BCR33DRAFT_247217 [Rhizoclosmatium globosum]